jgi:hypothetical protein
MQRSVCVAALAVMLGTAGAAHADPGNTTITAAFIAGDLVRLTTGWGKGANATLVVGHDKPVVLHDGDTAGALATGHGKIVIALAVDAADDPFEVITIADGKRGKPASIARPVDRHDVPFAVAATETPDGFTVFFQEIQSDDPSAAHTYMAKLDADGAPLGAAVEVPVPWSLGAAVWDGTGYHLALFYTESTGMRLSMVTLSGDGQPLEHPDWASRAGFISDVHLVAADGKVHAFYRGGSGGDRLLESDVTAIGSWGTEPKKAKDRGKLPLSSTIAITATGAPKKVK